MLMASQSLGVNDALGSSSLAAFLRRFVVSCVAIFTDAEPQNKAKIRSPCFTVLCHNGNLPRS